MVILITISTQFRYQTIYQSINLVEYELLTQWQRSCKINSILKAKDVRTLKPTLPPSLVTNTDEKIEVSQTLNLNYRNLLNSPFIDGEYSTFHLSREVFIYCGVARIHCGVGNNRAKQLKYKTDLDVLPFLSSVSIYYHLVFLLYSTFCGSHDLNVFRRLREKTSKSCTRWLATSLLISNGIQHFLGD